MLLKKIHKFIQSGFTETEQEKEISKHPDRYKECPNCKGLGFEDMFVNCDSCNHTGYVRKNYQDYLDSLPELEDK